MSGMETMEGRLKGYVDSLDVLQGRIRNTIDLVSGFRNLRAKGATSSLLLSELTGNPDRIYVESCGAG